MSLAKPDILAAFAFALSILPVEGGQPCIVQKPKEAIACEAMDDGGTRWRLTFPPSSTLESSMVFSLPSRVRLIIGPPPDHPTAVIRAPGRVISAQMAADAFLELRDLTLESVAEGQCGAPCNGGVVSVRGGVLVVTGTQVAMRGGRIEGRGGGLYASQTAVKINPGSTLVLTDNAAGGLGGGAFFEDATLEGGDLRLEGNVAWCGGGLAASNTQMDVAHLHARRNRAFSEGGSLCLLSSYRPTEFRRAGFFGNMAPRGSGVYIRDAGANLNNALFAANRGSVIHVSDDATLNLHFVTLAKNLAHALATDGNGYINGWAVLLYKNKGGNCRDADAFLAVSVSDDWTCPGLPAVSFSLQPFKGAGGETFYAPTRGSRLLGLLPKPLCLYPLDLLGEHRHAPCAPGAVNRPVP